MCICLSTVRRAAKFILDLGHIISSGVLYCGYVNQNHRARENSCGIVHQFATFCSIDN
jgi:hypothetical protein